MKGKEMMNSGEFMSGGSMWFGGISMLLIAVLVILSIAALVKYLMK